MLYERLPIKQKLSLVCYIFIYVELFFVGFVSDLLHDLESYIQVILIWIKTFRSIC